LLAIHTHLSKKGFGITQPKIAVSIFSLLAGFPLKSGDPAALAVNRLALLPSGPDAVHGSAMRRG